MKPHRVLYITRIAKGGVTVVLDQLARGLDKHFYDPVVLFDTPQSSEIRQKLVSSNIKTIELMECLDILQDKVSSQPLPKRNIGSLFEKFLGKKVRQLYFVLKSARQFIFQEMPRIKRYVKIIRENKIDIVHTHSDLRRGKPEIVAARIAGVPCIIHHHGYTDYTRFDTLFAGFVDNNIYI